MLDFGSEDFDGRDDKARDEQDPPLSVHWSATSSYDIYMVDTPKEANGDEKSEDDPSKKQPKPRHQRRPSKSRHSKNSDHNSPHDSGRDDNCTTLVAENDQMQTANIVQIRIRTR